MSANNDPAVSVLVVTYNQERYIRQALDSVLMQETDFAFEIVVADDGSQDSTPDILRDYQTRHPEIRLLLGETNVGVALNYKRAFDACRGEQIAILEGDDYWISPRKLEILYAFMQRHPECTLCFHRVIWLQEGSERVAIDPKLPADAQSGLLTASHLARGNFIRNASACMYRRQTLAGIEPEFWNTELRHWLLNLLLAQQGPIGYVPQILSVYRAHPGGVWSRKTAAEQSADILKRIDAYNRYLGFKFDAEFGHARRAVLRDSDPIRRGIRSFLPPILLTLIRGIYQRVVSPR